LERRERGKRSVRKEEGQVKTARGIEGAFID
jgi:hypothetical protein